MDLVERLLDAAFRKDRRALQRLGNEAPCLRGATLGVADAVSGMYRIGKDGQVEFRAKGADPHGD